MSDTLNLRLFGGFSIAEGDVPVRGFISAKAQALLCYLAMAERPQSRDALKALLWGDMPEERAAHSLRQALSNLQKLVGAHLIITRQTVAFDRASAYTLDVEAFSALLKDAETAGIAAARHRQEAVALYVGEFLAGFAVRDAPEFDDWLSGQRTWLRQRALGALGQLIAHYGSRGEYAEAEACVRHLLALDPWREEAHQQLMLVLAYQGQRDAALAQYDICRRTLADALGQEPAAKTTALYQRIRAGEVKAPASREPPSAVPVAPTPIIGRESDLARITQLLDDPARRLLTLVGPGGIGKTRLALRLAADLARDFKHGVYFVPLASVREPTLVIGAIARALDIEDTPALPLLERLKTALAERELLLVLDNFEQVIAAAPLLAELLETARGLRLLVTSRARLRLRGERIYTVPPLAVPALEAEPLAEVVARFPAVEMFVEWARAVVPEFALDDANARLVAEICVCLEGLPLAIELAVARLNLLPLPVLLARLEQRLAVLTAGPRDLPARQRTMRGTIAWSYDLLSEPARRLFAQCAVFVGGCALGAAFAVCAVSDASPPLDDADDADDADYTEDAHEARTQLALAELVENSLLRREEEPPGGGRLRMLETIREYALERLRATGDEQALRRRHAEYFLAFAEDAASRLSGPEQKTWLDRLAMDHANLRAALGWARSAGEPALALRIATALRAFWGVRGYLSEGRQWLEELLALDRRAATPVAPRVRAGALRAAGVLAFQQGDLTSAAELCEEGLALSLEIGDTQTTASLLNSLGNVRRDQGEYREATALHERYLTLVRELCDERGIAVALNSLGSTAHRQGDMARAGALFTESLALRRALGDAAGVAYTLGNLGDVALEMGDLDRAAALGEESLALYRELGHKWGIARGLDSLGAVAIGRGDLGQARALCQESLALCEEIGESWGIASALRNLGAIARGEGQGQRTRELLERSLARYREGGGNLVEVATVLAELGAVVRAGGDGAQAGALFSECLAVCQRIGNAWVALRAVVGLALIEALGGGESHAARLWGAAEALRARLDAPWRPHEWEEAARMIGSARARLGEEAWAEAFEAGRALSLAAVLRELDERPTTIAGPSDPLPAPPTERAPIILDGSVQAQQCSEQCSEP